MRRAELHRAAADWYGERDPALRAEHLDRYRLEGGAARLLDAANAQASALHPDRALALAERGAVLAKLPADIVALNMLRGRLCCDSGEEFRPSTLFKRPSLPRQNPSSGAVRCSAWPPDTG